MRQAARYASRSQATTEGFPSYPARRHCGAKKPADMCIGEPEFTKMRGKIEATARVFENGFPQEARRSAPRLTKWKEVRSPPKAEAKRKTLSPLPLWNRQQSLPRDESQSTVQ